MKSSDNLVWIDLEMTGLDHKNDTIIEIATIVTDGDLNVLAEGPNLVIHQSKDVMDNMNAWCRKHHGDSGLTDNVLSSTISMAEAERLTLEFIKPYIIKGKSPLCGNSIGQDKAFLYEYMPDLLNYLHYRVIDVSSIKELATRWYRKEDYFLEKQGSHRALDDIIESIAELAHYRKALFLDPKQIINGSENCNS